MKMRLKKSTTYILLFSTLFTEFLGISFIFSIFNEFWEWNGNMQNVDAQKANYFTQHYNHALTVSIHLFWTSTPSSWAAQKRHKHTLSSP